jgi:two-component system cell cycle response regulator DivK
MKKILLIEDNEANTNLIRRILSIHPYEVIHASDATSGISKAYEIQPDLILLDIGLPDLSGTMVVNRLKQIAHTEHIPIVAVTADTTMRTKRLAMDYGCEDVIYKPIETRFFHDRIASYLGYAEYAS